MLIEGKLRIFEEGKNVIGNINFLQLTRLLNFCTMNMYYIRSSII